MEQLSGCGASNYVQVDLSPALNTYVSYNPDFSLFQSKLFQKEIPTPASSPTRRPSSISQPGTCPCLGVALTLPPSPSAPPPPPPPSGPAIMRAEREEQMERGLWDYGKGGEGPGRTAVCGKKPASAMWWRAGRPTPPPGRLSGCCCCLVLVQGTGLACQLEAGPESSPERRPPTSCLHLPSLTMCSALFSPRESNLN